MPAVPVLSQTLHRTTPVRQQTLKVEFTFRLHIFVINFFIFLFAVC